MLTPPRANVPVSIFVMPPVPATMPLYARMVLAATSIVPPEAPRLIPRLALSVKLAGRRQLAAVDQ